MDRSGRQSHALQNPQTLCGSPCLGFLRSFTEARRLVLHSRMSCAPIQIVEIAVNPRCFTVLDQAIPVLHRTEERQRHVGDHERHGPTAGERLVHVRNMEGLQRE